MLDLRPIHKKPKELIGLFFLVTIMSLHIVSAFFAIRKWPLSDYPMFSFPKAKFSSINRIFFENVFQDGHSEIWTHEDYKSIGLNDHRLQAHADNPNHPRVKELLIEKVHHSSKLQSYPPKSIRIMLRTSNVEKSGELKFSTTLIQAIPYWELSR